MKEILFLLLICWTQKICLTWKNQKILGNIFFYQPFLYTLNDIDIKSSKIIYTQKIKRPPTYVKDDILKKIYKPYFDKYIKIKYKYLEPYSNIEFENNIQNKKRILGIIARGTDYTSIKPKRHRIPPTADLLISDCKKEISNYKFDNIYLVTEDKKIEDEFKKEFSNILILSNQNTIETDGKKYLSDYHYNDDIIERSRRYLKSVLYLCECTKIIGAHTSAATFIKLQCKNEYYFYNLGIYR